MPVRHTENAAKWRYFGRTGGAGRIIEIFRVPADQYDGRLDFRHFQSMERLLGDGRWVGGQNERAERDWAGGWLNYRDEIGPEEVERLFNKWKTGDWQV